MMTKPLKQFVLFFSGFALASAAVLGVGLDTASAQTKGWADGKSTSKPSTSDLIPTMSSNESYTERYGFAVDLDDGGHIGVDWTISNLGWGDGHGGAAVRVRLPGEKNYSHSEKLSEDEWSYSKNTFDLDISDTRVRAKGSDSFVVTHEGEDVSFNLTFKNTTDMWKPGTGRIAVEDGYYKFNLLAPRADVTGTVTIGGKTQKVKGTKRGYADHVATNVAPFDFGKRFSRFRNYNGDIFVMWREIELTDEHGGDSFTWVVVGYKDQIVFSDADADVKFARLRHDPKAGYKFPMAIQIDGKDGKDSIQLIMRGKKFERKDLLAAYGTAAKMVASTVSNPFRYKIDCDYSLKMTVGGATAKVNGKSHFVLDYVTE